MSDTPVGANQDNSGVSPAAGANGAGQVNAAKLFVGNLTYSVNDAQLQELFGQYGEIEEAVVLMEKQWGRSDRPPRSRGMGFVTFKDPADAKAAVAALHDQEFEGRRMIVEVAKPPIRRDNFRRDN